MTTPSEGPAEPGLPPESRPPDADEVDDMLARLDGAMGPGPEDPSPGAGQGSGGQGSGGWGQWAVAGALGCALAGVVALWFGWRPTPGASVFETWQTTALEGVTLGLASGLAFSWWESVQQRRIDALSCVLLILALVTLYLVLVHALLEQALGSLDPQSLAQRAATSLQLSAVLVASLLGYLKARVLPLRPLLGLAGGVFASSCLAQVLDHYVGGGLEATTGLPYAFALPLSWTLAELFGRSSLKTAAD